MSVKDLISAIASGSAINTENAFNQVMSEKISARLDDMRVEVAQSMFKEQVEVTEEAELTLEDYSAEEIEEFMQTEDYEQLDELSKGTMATYLAKAGKDSAKREAAKNELNKTSDEIWKNTSSLGNRHLSSDAANKLADAGHQARKELDKQYDKHSEKQWKREKGIHTAIKKLSK